MTTYLLTVDYQKGVIEAPMTEWSPDEITAHMDYYGVLLRELADSGELVDEHAFTGVELAKVVTWDGVTAPGGAALGGDAPAG